MLLSSLEDSQEPLEAGSPNRLCRANASDVEDALTQIVQTYKVFNNSSSTSATTGRTRRPGLQLGQA